VSVEKAIICDGCAVLMSAGKTAARARVDARQNGAATGLPGGQDLCNECRPASPGVSGQEDPT
jgi:hypothetical protein